MHPSVALLLGLLMTGGDNDSAPLRKQTSALNIPAPLVATGTPAPVTTWSQDAPLPSSTYYMEGQHQHDAAPLLAGESTTCGGDCQGCQKRGCHLARWMHLFPSPGDMPMHIPYIAEPKNYYYFRPYNWFHIPEHQREVMNHLPPGDPRNPYDARFMRDIYLQVEEKYGDLEVLPGGVQDRGASPNDTLPPPNGPGLLPLQTYGNENQSDFDRPAIFSASSRRVRK